MKWLILKNRTNDWTKLDWGCYWDNLAHNNRVQDGSRQGMELYNQAADIVGPKVQIGYDPKDGVYMY